MAEGKDTNVLAVIGVIRKKKLRNVIEIVIDDDRHREAFDEANRLISTECQECGLTIEASQVSCMCRGSSDPCEYSEPSEDRDEL